MGLLLPDLGLREVPGVSELHAGLRAAALLQRSLSARRSAAESGTESFSAGKNQHAAVPVVRCEPALCSARRCLSPPAPEPGLWSGNPIKLPLDGEELTAG